MATNFEFPGGFKSLTPDPTDPRSKRGTIAEVQADATYYIGYPNVFIESEGKHYKITGGSVGAWVLEEVGVGQSPYLGTYISLAALQLAHPTAEPGSYAIVDAGVGVDAVKYIWDESDSDWVAGGGAGGLTPQQESDLAAATEHIDGADEVKHSATQISLPTELLGATNQDEYNIANEANKAVKIAAPTENRMWKSSVDGQPVETTFTDSQVLNTEDIDVSDPLWLESESRLLMVTKQNGQADFQSTAILVNIFAPPGVDPQLTDRSGWTNESKTITGANTNGELGKPGQVRILADGTYCWCQSATVGASGSATYKRNRAHDVIDTANTQDLAVANALELETGWDVATQTKVLTIAARLGTFHKQNGGYFYWCYAVSGTNSYWWRNGTPASWSLMINATSHPTLTGRLNAHDFTVAVYTQQAGDETTRQGQQYYNATTRRLFYKVTTTLWERLI